MVEKVMCKFPNCSFVVLSDLLFIFFLLTRLFIFFLFFFFFICLVTVEVSKMFLIPIVADLLTIKVGMVLVTVPMKYILFLVQI